jgi:hypothetical protein
LPQLLYFVLFGKRGKTPIVALHGKDEKVNEEKAALIIKPHVKRI